MLRDGRCGPRRDRSWADCRVRMTLSEARRHAGTTTSSRTVFWFFEHTRTVFWFFEHTRHGNTEALSTHWHIHPAFKKYSFNSCSRKMAHRSECASVIPCLRGCLLFAWGLRMG